MPGGGLNKTLDSADSQFLTRISNQKTELKIWEYLREGLAAKKSYIFIGGIGHVVPIIMADDPSACIIVSVRSL